jgi:hypothetical protein
MIYAISNLELDYENTFKAKALDKMCNYAKRVINTVIALETKDKDYKRVVDEKDPWVVWARSNELNLLWLVRFAGLRDMYLWRRLLNTFAEYANVPPKDLLSKTTYLMLDDPIDYIAASHSACDKFPILGIEEVSGDLATEKAYFELACKEGIVKEAEKKHLTEVFSINFAAVSGMKHSVVKSDFSTWELVRWVIFDNSIALIYKGEEDNGFQVVDVYLLEELLENIQDGSSVIDPIATAKVKADKILSAAIGGRDDDTIRINWT